MFPKHKVAATVVVLNENNKILLIKQRNRGWVYPGGYVENGESIKAGAIREVKEESGIDIEVTKFCGVYQEVKNSKFIFLFLGKSIGGALSSSFESLEAGYFTIDEALSMVTWKNLRERIIECLNEEVYPFITEV